VSGGRERGFSYNRKIKRCACARREEGGREGVEKEKGMETIEQQKPS